MGVPAPLPVSSRAPNGSVPSGEALTLTLGWQVAAPLTAAPELAVTLRRNRVAAPVIASTALGLARPGDRFVTVSLIPTAPEDNGALLLSVWLDRAPAFETNAAVQGRAIRFAAPPITAVLNIRFGEAFDLAGYSIEPDRAAAGEQVAVRLVWRAAQRPAVRYKSFVHLLDAAERVVAQYDSEPVDDTLPTTRWDKGEYVEDIHLSRLPVGLPRGSYRVQVGVYRWPAGARLPVVSGGDALALPQPIIVTGR